MNAVITPRFLSDAHLRPIPRDERLRRRLDPKTKLWELMQPLTYRSVVASLIVTVPAGYVTDLASVPRGPLVFLFAGDVIHEEAVPHDFFYGTHLVPQTIADLALAECMEVTQAGTAAQRWAIYRAVWAVGFRAYASGPSRLTILNRDTQWLAEMATTGLSGWSAQNCLAPLSGSEFA